MPNAPETLILRNNQAPLRQPSRTIEVRVPASTSNLGAGFDCFGLALQLYLTVRATIIPASNELCRVRSCGTDASSKLPRGTDNLIYRAMRFAAERHGFELPSVRLAVHNQIPLDGGLGSSGAAIIAGLMLATALTTRFNNNADCETPLITVPSTDDMLRDGVWLEHHPDNVAAALLGGLVTSCVKAADGSVVSIKHTWPSEVKVIIISPHVSLKTAAARAVLPEAISRHDAVHNLQRAVLFTSAIETKAYDLLWEAMQDRWHQAYRQTLVPGLTEALATPRLDGLLGVALSGAGPGVVALALGNFTEIGNRIADCFHHYGTQTTVRVLEVDNQGAKLK